MGVDRERLEEGWRTLIAELPPGVTHLALHCTTPGDFSAMSPMHAGWRYAEHELIASGFLRGLCAAAGVAMIGTRSAQRLWLEAG